jgi:hypothetical protein
VVRFRVYVYKLNSQVDCFPDVQLTSSLLASHGVIVELAAAKQDSILDAGPSPRRSGRVGGYHGS